MWKTGELALALNQIAHYRRWSVDRFVIASAETRGEFRWIASSDTHRIVALFGDFRAANARRKRYIGDSVLPHADAIVDAVQRANDETKNEYPDKRLLVMFLFASTKRTFDVNGIDVISKLRATVDIEPWHVEDFGIDPIAHVATPNHRFASDEERDQFEREHLPKIFDTDPVVRWLGFRVGDVVAIERDSPDTGRSLYFRQVVTKKVLVDVEPTETGSSVHVE
jgi:DNA-directed RNA polymerase subunit H